jgi:hypothetical protein
LLFLKDLWMFFNRPAVGEVTGIRRRQSSGERTTHRTLFRSPSNVVILHSAKRGPKEKKRAARLDGH